MAKDKNNGLFNFPSSDSRGRMDSYEEGGKVEAKEYKKGGIVDKVKKTEKYSDLDASSRRRHEYLQKRSPAYKESAISKAKEKLKKKKNKYEKGGKVKVSKGIVTQTGKRVSNTEVEKKDGKTRYKTTSAHQVETPEGKRWYKGEGTSSRRGIASDKAKLRALAKSVSTPSDSLVAGGKDPILASKKKPKKKKFWQK